MAFDDVVKRLQKLRRTAKIVESGAKLLRSTGLSSALGPRVALTMARDARRGIKGTLAIIHLHAVSDPLRPAVVCGDVRLNYGELEARINRLSHAFSSLGVGPGDRVGVMVHNGHEHLEMSASLGAIGATTVQIGYRLKGSEVAYILSNSRAKAMVFHGDLAPAVEDALKETEAPLGKKECVAIGGAGNFLSYDEFLERGDPSFPHVAGGGYGGVMIYTSGTTGRSKGASRDFRKMGLDVVLNFISQLPLKRDDRHLVVCPMYHSAAPAFVTMVMTFGGCVVIMPRFEPEEVLRTIERERITSSMMVPTMYARLTSAPKDVIRKYDYSSLRWLMSGAAPLPTELARRVEETFGSILYNFYGATETGIVTIARPGDHTARPGTIGRLVEGNAVRLLDAEGRDVPEGQVGEVYVKNGMMMDGYFGNEKATREASREGFISVGDLAWRDAEGYYYLADRKTDMVISGGVNIYPWEIEQRLHEHPAVADVAVVGVPDPEWGETLVAFVVLREGMGATPEELGAHVSEKLADFKKPRRWFFVESLPRNPTGKILKRELKTQAAASVQAVS